MYPAAQYIMTMQDKFNATINNMEFEQTVPGHYRSATEKIVAIINNESNVQFLSGVDLGDWFTIGGGYHLKGKSLGDIDVADMQNYIAAFGFLRKHSDRPSDGVYSIPNTSREAWRLAAYRFDAVVLIAQEDLDLFGGNLGAIAWQLKTYANLFHDNYWSWRLVRPFDTNPDAATNTESLRMNIAAKSPLPSGAFEGTIEQAMEYVAVQAMGTVAEFDKKPPLWMPTDDCLSFEPIHPLTLQPLWSSELDPIEAAKKILVDAGYSVMEAKSITK